MGRRFGASKSQPLTVAYAAVRSKAATMLFIVVFMVYGGFIDFHFSFAIMLMRKRELYLNWPTGVLRMLVLCGPSSRF